IGDEFRYIIDRRFAHKYPGNMLERPSLLLNPWAIRSTETGQQTALEGEAFRGEAKQGASAGGRAAGGVAAAPAQADFANLDFLAESSLVVANVLPDKKGVIELKRSDLGAHQELLFVAVDPENTASRIVTLADPKADFLDLRLAKSLDPKQHFTQQKRISILAAGEKLVIPDITSTHFEQYDNLSRVFALYKALNNDAKLGDFGFIRDWPSLKTDEKRALYLKYASHEMHLFLYKKDPEFFKTAIRPYLANKKEKQFIDRWLLEDDLSDYLKPWNFEQLNTFERVLLGERVKGQKATVARLVKDQFELLPPDPDRFNMLFQTALKGSSLDTGDALGLRKAQEEAERVKTLSRSYGAFVQAADQPADAATLAVNGAVRYANAPAPAAPPASTPEAPAEKTPQAGFYAKADVASKKMADRLALGGAIRDMSEAKDAKKEVEFLSDDRAKLAAVQQYYRKLDKTMEWVESNYYKLPLEQQVAGLITANPFWRDVAAHDLEKPLFSTNMAEATHNFPEMLAAMALLDLPFKAGEHKSQFKGTQMTLTAGSPMIVYHEEILPATKVADHAPILVSQNFFRNGDRFRQENGEQIDKFVSDEFLVNVVYGCQIVVTNPTSSKKKIDVLLQIPTGALAVSNGQYTKSVHLDLDPYHTQTLEYYFYFPFPGKFAHYPVQVAGNGAAGNGEVLAFAEPFTFNVVRQLTNIDKQSWDYISQYGSQDDVLNFLKTENVLRVNLDRIAWRMHDKAFFEKVIDLLSARHIYNNTLWSYGVAHDDVAAIRQFLQFAAPFVQQCGDWLDSPLLTIDPVARHAYEHMDYKPLVNARVGQLGRKREILNDRFLAQYQRLLKIFSYRRQLDSPEMMSVVYYLLLQDRVGEALDFFGRVDADQLATRLQYDYFDAYLDFYKSEPKQARQIAAKYAEYPVDRWRNAFANIVNQVDEIGKATVKVVDKEDRTQIQAREASATPSFSFNVESKKVRIAYQNLKRVQVNYYQMDIELLFSRNPFVQGDSKQFANILPNQTETVDLPEKDSTFEFPLPEKLATSNLLIEITGAGGTQSQAYYSNALRVQTVENFGQLRVNLDRDGSPLPKVYVKVYARMKDGAVKFYKDGYTDLRGYFDYTSLNTNELDFVDRFSILILSENHGAVVREAAPPKR
ncbi:MAG TPA: hypothetical protein VKB78_09780, partial [Pirellulales bacterium]|nr:hypothetical protein [Pirellulales bacterium]